MVIWRERDINQRISHLRSSQSCPAIFVLNHSALFQAKAYVHGWVVCGVWKSFINWLKVNILKKRSAVITVKVGAMWYGGMCHAITHEQHAFCRLPSVPTKGLRRAQYIFLSMSACIAYKICCSCHSQVVFQMEDFVFVWSLWQQCLKWSALGCIMGLSPPQCLLKTSYCSPFAFYSCLCSSFSWHWIIQYVDVSVAFNLCFVTFYSFLSVAQSLCSKCSKWQNSVTLNQKMPVFPTVSWAIFFFCNPSSEGCLHWALGFHNIIISIAYTFQKPVLVIH